MEREIIERLAMDRALGELNEDTTALLEAYLAEHPEFQPDAEQISQTCELTSRAIDRKTGLGQTMPMASPARASRKPPIRLNRWARWAAVIFISITIGNFWGRFSAPRSPLVRTVMVAATPKTERQNLTNVLSETGEGFWRDKARAILDTKTSSVPKPHSAGGGLWDRYRRLSKERGYE